MGQAALGLYDESPWGHAHLDLHSSPVVSGFNSLLRPPHTILSEEVCNHNPCGLGNEVYLSSPFGKEHSTDV